ncbi:MAG: hypothetical protein K5651_04660 [Bacteroidales bacterium]|nr:hypothetical protein [Bacteroidales bacterium]
MSIKTFDRTTLAQEPLSHRKNKVQIERSYVRPDAPDPVIDDKLRSVIARLATYILEARANGSYVMLSFGAHSIKNGLGPLMVEFMKKGWINHLATNGAGIIHDWEFAFQGQSSESVAQNLPQGRFGIWNETGLFLNLAITVGAYEGLGYGAGVGKAIEEKGLIIPSEEELISVITHEKSLEKVSAAADLLSVVRKQQLQPGWMDIPTPYAHYSMQAGAYQYGVASTDHPMFGHDIIYTHAANCGSAVGRAAERDFLSFVDSVSRLSGGVYLSLGSAVMSPLVFEKAFTMAQNAALQKGRTISGHHIAIVDLGKISRDWKRSHPASLDFLMMDNRDFLLVLYHELCKRTK